MRIENEFIVINDEGELVRVLALANKDFILIMPNTGKFKKISIYEFQRYKDNYENK